jgi:hypothetical protein
LGILNRLVHISFQFAKRISDPGRGHGLAPHNSYYNLRHATDCFSIVSMAKGGPRPGAGRKKGATNRPQLRAYFTPEEIKR